MASHWVVVFGLSVILVAVIGGWLLLWHYFGELGVGSHWVSMSVSFLLVGGVVVALILGIIVFLVFKGRE